MWKDQRTHWKLMFELSSDFFKKLLFDSINTFDNIFSFSHKYDLLYTISYKKTLYSIITLSSERGSKGYNALVF